MMHCDIETGLCETETEVNTETTMAMDSTYAQILYATDPICSHCWAMEPAWRKLLYHYGDRVAVRYIYGGLLADWDGFADRGAGIYRPADVVPHWEEVARHYGQPIDPSVWERDPLDSSYPPSIAALTVRLLDPGREEAFLRRIREAIFLEARNITRPEVLAACAADVGLDAKQFLRVLKQPGAEKRFMEDLNEVRRRSVRGFPTMIIEGPDGDRRVLRGTSSFARMEEALLMVTRLPRSERTPSPSEVLAAYGSGTTPEFAEVLSLSREETARALKELGAHPMPVAGDVLWSVEERSHANGAGIVSRRGSDPGPSAQRAGASLRAS